MAVEIPRSVSKYVNTILLLIVSFLLADMHSQFRELVKDVNQMKSTIERHEYIIGTKRVSDFNNKHKEDNLTCFLCQLEGILPNDKTKVEKDGQHKKV